MRTCSLFAPPPSLVQQILDKPYLKVLMADRLRLEEMRAASLAVASSWPSFLHDVMPAIFLEGAIWSIVSSPIHIVIHSQMAP